MKMINDLSSSVGSLTPGSHLSNKDNTFEVSMSESTRKKEQVSFFFFFFFVLMLVLISVVLRLCQM